MSVILFLSETHLLRIFLTRRSWKSNGKPTNRNDGQRQSLHTSTSVTVSGWNCFTGIWVSMIIIINTRLHEMHFNALLMKCPFRLHTFSSCKKGCTKKLMTNRCFRGKTSYLSSAAMLNPISESSGTRYCRGSTEMTCC
jgi:hypothetical protein